jgi:hypothetical protein
MVQEFELTSDDIIDFNMHHLGNLKSYLRIEKRNKMIIALVMLFGLIYFATTMNVPYIHYLALLLVVGGALAFSGYSSYMRRSIARKIRKEIAEHENSGFVGYRRIEIDKYRISESGSIGESSCLWTAVRAIEKNDKLIIVYISSVSAYIIPRRVFNTDNEFNDYYNQIVEMRNALL